MTGTVLWGVNNIYTVQWDSRRLECRIKGKVLAGKKDAYNPLAPGDSVEVEIAAGEQEKGMIVYRHPRKNQFARWNKKRQARQIIAANIDGCFCITSPESPPFRPRFIDRVTVTAEVSDIPATVVCNKTDQHTVEQVSNRLTAFEKAGYPVLYCSAVLGSGIGMVAEALRGRRMLFLGQSGVGKTTLINLLIPGLQRKTAGISPKHNRGKHTTVYSELLQGRDFEIIDTPGIREIGLFGIERQNLPFYFPDITPYIGGCRYPSCRHLDEPACSVKEAVLEKKIHPDRYESYCRIFSEIAEKEQEYG